MIIGSIDRKKTAQLQKRNKRKQLDTIRKSKHAKTEEGDANIGTGRFDLTETANDISSDEEEDSDSSTNKPPRRLLKLLPKLNATRMHKTGCLSLH